MELHTGGRLKSSLMLRLLTEFHRKVNGKLQDGPLTPFAYTILITFPGLQPTESAGTCVRLW